MNLVFGTNFSHIIHLTGLYHVDDQIACIPLQQPDLPPMIQLAILSVDQEAVQGLTLGVNHLAILVVKAILVLNDSQSKIVDSFLNDALKKVTRKIGKTLVGVQLKGQSV